MTRTARGVAIRRWSVLVGVAAVAAGSCVVAARTKDVPGKGWRRAFLSAFVGVPSGRLGRAGARVLAMRHSFFAAMAGELSLQPQDDLLDVGCGSAGLLAEQASHVRYVAGLDLSEIQLGMARQRLADRIAAGTAEIVMGDAHGAALGGRAVQRRRLAELREVHPGSSAGIAGDVPGPSPRWPGRADVGPSAFPGPG